MEKLVWCKVKQFLEELAAFRKEQHGIKCGLINHIKSGIDLFYVKGIGYKWTIRDYNSCYLKYKRDIRVPPKPELIL